MHKFSRGRWSCGLACLAIAVATGERLCAEDPSFPSSLLRWAQNAESAQSSPPVAVPETHTDEPTNAKATAHNEQRQAVLNLLASNRADAEERRKAHAQEKDDWEAKLEALTTAGLAEPKPYSFLELDKARDELAAERQNANNLDDAIARAKQALTRASEEQDAKERDVRRAKDELEHNQDAAATLALAVADAEHGLVLGGAVALGVGSQNDERRQLDALRQQQRTHVKFGVMYGSPTGKVTHLALKAAANHDRVFDRPAAFVIFNNFGDNALELELHFWVSVRALMERRQIESDIRFNIEHLFREAGIVIAYPQLDLHLYTEQPLRVQMAPAAELGEAA